MRILEATVAVMIVASVMVVVYSNQIDREDGSSAYFYDLEHSL